jgi:hypothetical protein
LRGEPCRPLVAEGNETAVRTEVTAQRLRGRRSTSDQ